MRCCPSYRPVTTKQGVFSESQSMLEELKSSAQEPTNGLGDEAVTSHSKLEGCRADDGFKLPWTAILQPATFRLTAEHQPSLGSIEQVWI